MPASALTVAARQALPDRASDLARQAAEYIPAVPRNVGPADRLISLGLGTCLVACGLTDRRGGLLSVAAGGYMLFRGLSGTCPFYQALGIGTDGPSGEGAVIPARSGVKVEHAVTINRPPAELYRRWRNLSQLPQFMTHLKEVRENGNTSHWVACGPMGMSVEWDAELVTDTPNQAIAWRSLPGSDVDTAGSVHFRPAAGGRGTEVRVTLKYDPPAGKVGSYISRVFGRSPERMIRDDLNRFKQLVEGGPSALPQPAGSC